jgi:hypothetical protein
MQYFIKRGDKVQGPISHERLLFLEEHKKLKKSDYIGVSQTGPFQELALAWDVIKRSQPVPKQPVSDNPPGTSLPKEDWMTLSSPTYPNDPASKSEVVKPTRIVDFVQKIDEFRKHESYQRTLLTFVLSLPFLLILLNIVADSKDAKRVDERIITAHPNQLERITEGLEREFSLGYSGHAIKSSQHQNAYSVAIPLRGPGIDGIGVWWTSGHPSEKGLILSANVLASEFSDWGAGKYTKANAWTSDSDCRKLLRYAEDRNY